MMCISVRVNASSGLLHLFALPRSLFPCETDASVFGSSRTAGTDIPGAAEAPIASMHCFAGAWQCDRTCALRARKTDSVPR